MAGIAVICLAGSLGIVPRLQAEPAASAIPGSTPPVRADGSKAAPGQNLPAKGQSAIPEGSVRIAPRTQFDEARVRELLTDVDKDDNARLLKFEYFAKFAGHPYPRKEGYSLLEQALAAEPADSIQRVWLESVRAFASFRLGRETGAKGFDYYLDLFNEFKSDARPQALAVVQESINELALTAVGRYGREAKGFPEVAGPALMAALDFHLRLLEKNSSSVNPPWAMAIAKTGTYDPANELLDEALKRAGGTASFGLLKLAAAIKRRPAPDQALALLKRAKPLLPTGDKAAAGSYYDELVGLLVEGQRLSEAIAAQKERIQMTGQGYTVLVRLYRQNGDQKGFEDAMTALRSPQANEQDINDTADLLADWYPGGKATLAPEHDIAINLLIGYLEAARTRTVEQELRARLRLAQILITDQRNREAQAVLEVTVPESSLTNLNSRMYYSAITKMRQAPAAAGTQEAGK